MFLAVMTRDPGRQPAAHTSDRRRATAISSGNARGNSYVGQL
jgi:hypothetical protein